MSKNFFAVRAGLSAVVGEYNGIEIEVASNAEILLHMISCLDALHFCVWRDVPGVATFLDGTARTEITDITNLCEDSSYTLRSKVYAGQADEVPDINSSLRSSTSSGVYPILRFREPLIAVAGSRLYVCCITPNSANDYSLLFQERPGPGQ